MQFVFGSDFLWDVRKFQPHIFKPLHWCVQIEVFHIKNYTSRVFRGYDTVEQDLD
jgi:hypothetical protein